MGTNTAQRILFGLKVKQYRQAKGLSFVELAGLTGMSVSYLNEIEKGKKHPKANKIALLAEALQVPLSELDSEEVSDSLVPVAELLRSNFLNELPLEQYGIDMTKVVEIIASAPPRVGAFVSTLLELARDYTSTRENFYFGALRSYLELHNSYFEDLEQAVLRFAGEFQLPAERPLPPRLLKDLLEQHFGYTVHEEGLDAYPELSSLRALYLPNKKELWLHGRMNEAQKGFQYGKELGFAFLVLKERAWTSTLMRSKTFEEVLNHSRAIYFSVALHLPQALLHDALRELFQQKKWDGARFLGLLRRFDVTPEMLFHRMTNLLPRFFQMQKLFFLRFVHDAVTGHFRVDKELYLHLNYASFSNRSHEHHCRRWQSISLLQELQDQAEHRPVAQLAAAQVSHNLHGGHSFLCLSIARSGYPTPVQNVSNTLCMLITPAVQEQVAFLSDPNIPHRQVYSTCERCNLEGCNERSAAPVIAARRARERQIQDTLQQLLR